ncbi:MAG: MFS transporter, partial [Acidimicrobiales bacterium]
LLFFFIIEGRIKSPLLPLRLITDRVRAGAFLSQLFVGLGLFGMFLFMTFYFQEIEKYSSVKTGLLFMPFSIGIILAAGGTSQLLPKIGPRPLATIGNVIAAIGMFYLSFIKVDSSYVMKVMPAMILTSVGLGMAFVAIASTALFNVRPQDTGAASAVLTTSQQIGGSFGTAISSTIVVSSGTAFFVARSHPGLNAAKVALLHATANVHGYDQSFRFGSLMLLLAAIAFGVLVNINRHHLGQHDEVGAP